MSEYLIPKASTFGKLLFQGKGEEIRTNRHVTAVKYNVISERQKDLLDSDCGIKNICSGYGS